MKVNITDNWSRVRITKDAFQRLNKLLRNREIRNKQMIFEILCNIKAPNMVGNDEISLHGR